MASGDGPLALSANPGAAATLAIAGALALGARRPSTAGRAGRLHAAADVFGGAVRDAIGHVRSADPRLLGALAWWTFDAAVLWAMLHAFGAPPPFAVVVLAYFVGQVGNTIPIPGAVAAASSAFSSPSPWPTSRSSRCSPIAPSPSGYPRRSAWSPSVRCAGRWPAGAPRMPWPRSRRRTRRRPGRSRARPGRAGAGPCPEPALLAA